jgi:hypothetical protein
MPHLAQILVAAGAGFISAPVEAIQLVFGGIAGDRHAGWTRPSCSRTPWHPRRTEITNTRQISILSVEELAEIAAMLDLETVDAGLLGANLVIQGIAALSALPPSTRLRFPSGATLFVTEENAPCRQPGAALAAAHGRPRLESAFAKAAIGRRGLLALVEREGTVKTGDGIEAIVPRPRAAPKPLP